MEVEKDIFIGKKKEKSFELTGKKAVLPALLFFGVVVLIFAVVIYFSLKG